MQPGIMSCLPSDEVVRDAYRTIEIEDALKDFSAPKGYTHGSHAALYFPTDQLFLGKYPIRYVVMMQMRFDGTLGFPGGVVDEGESPEEAVNRELSEELGCKVGDFKIERKDHVFTQVSEQTKFCLHFYAKQLEESEFKRVEEKAIKGHDYGHEVLGVIRVPLYTLPNGLGFPAFLLNQFIGSSKMQLLKMLEVKKIFSKDEIVKVLERSKSINTAVTAEEIDY